MNSILPTPDLANSWLLNMKITLAKPRKARGNQSPGWAFPKPGFPNQFEKSEKEAACIHRVVIFGLYTDVINQIEVT